MQLSKAAIRELKQAAKTIKGFAEFLLGVILRPYQIEAANAIINSVFQRDGMTFVIIFSRQSGKDETLAILFLFLMFRFFDWGIEMISTQPTFKPQSITAMERIKKRGINFGKRLTRTAGYIMRLGASRTSYFSTEPTANIVSATGRLLVGNEAQDIDAAIWDGKIVPMGANENATKVLSGTRWTQDTLLERELKLALAAQKKDGVKRVFMVSADDVRKVNPLYGKYVDAEIKKLGRQHPLIKSQYFNELLDTQTGMFPARRLALMQGDQPAQTKPIAGHIYGLTIDVAGMDEAMLNLDGMGNPGRDSTTISMSDIDLSSLEILQAPTYRIVMRDQWKGQSHVTIFGKLCAIIDLWQPQYIVIDATGVGEGLWAMLEKKYPGRVIPVKFTQQTKSEIGYAYLAMIETGRLRNCVLTDEVRMQYQKCQSEILPGPAKTMRWGVKDGTRGPDGLLVHDDFVLSDAMTSELDKLEWSLQFETTIIEGQDPIQDMDGNF